MVILNNKNKLKEMSLPPKCDKKLEKYTDL